MTVWLFAELLLLYLGQNQTAMMTSCSEIRHARAWLQLPVGSALVHSFAVSAVSCYAHCLLRVEMPGIPAAAYSATADGTRLCPLLDDVNFGDMRLRRHAMTSS
mmetsp:Transcript_36565/g.93239  ORF Transcript_36565/g.93239 Transcript_36565/m.93239 type:complete len:104 (-) Transcript_36565:99-410(-)